MACFNLNDRLLSVSGIIARLEDIHLSLNKIPQEKHDEVCLKRLESMREDLRSIFFDGLDTLEIYGFLSSLNSPYPLYYPNLAQALLSIFSANSLSKDTLSQMIGHIHQFKEEDWQPKEADLVFQFNQLNNEHGYFEPNKSLMALYKSLVVSCREVCVLIERNNTPADTMAYVYAYKLMAILVDVHKPLPSFEQLSKQIESLLAPKDKKVSLDIKYFHDHLLDLRLPNPERHNRAAWSLFINHNGVKALPFFSMAEIMEDITLGRAPTTLKEARDLEAQLVYKRASEDTDWAKLCHANNVLEAMFNSGLNYIGSPPVWPKKKGDKIPAVTIKKGSYIWTKLSASDKRGLILGKITDCCQSIVGDSSQCVKDAMSLSENALYVLLKRKKETSNPFTQPDGSINDEDYQIIGQSYVWKSNTGNLCLDSVECLRESIKSEELSSILSAFGDQVIQDDPSVKRVTLGTGGKTPKNLFAEVKIPEKISQGYFYGDAIKQYLISRTPSQLTDEQIENLQARYSKKFFNVMLYLCDYLVDTTNLLERLEQLVKNHSNNGSDLFKSFNSKTLVRLLHFTRKPILEDLEYIDFNALQPVGIHSETPYIWSTARLIWQADTSEKRIKALPHIRGEDRLDVVIEKDPEGETLLHHVAENPELLKVIFSCLSKSECLAAVKQKNHDGETILHRAAMSPESFELILSIYPESECLAAVNEKDKNGETVLHYLAQNFKLLQLILPFYKESELLTAVKEKNQYGDSVLRYAVENIKSLELILSLYPESERLAGVKEKNYNHDTLLHHATSNFESFELILSLYPESERLSAVEEKNKSGTTVLHLATVKPKLLELVLSLYPESKRLAAVKMKNNFSSSVLHYATSNPESFKLILSLYPASERLSAVEEKSFFNGESVLSLALPNPEILEILLLSLPMPHVIALGHKNPSIDFNVLKKVIINQATALNYTAQQLTSLEQVKDIVGLQEKLNIMTQGKLKESLPRHSEALSEKSKFRP